MKPISLWQHIQANYPELMGLMKQHLRSQNASDIVVEDARSGGKTCYVLLEGRKRYLHSKYDPEREALTLLEKEQAAIEAQDDLVLFGLGMGHLAKVILKHYPHKQLLILEPSPVLLAKSAEHLQLESIHFNQIKLIHAGNDMQHIASFAAQVLQKTHGHFSLVVLPGAQQVYPEVYQQFKEALKKAVQSKRVDVRVINTYKDRWAINSIRNLPHLLNTPNVLEHQGKFSHKPAIIVAAGPSLMDEIENLRSIKKNETAYLFSAGSAIKTLLMQGIEPDAVVSYDPQSTNYNVFNLIRQMNLNHIPLLFGSCVGHETVDLFPGPAAHFLVNQDKTSPWFLSPKQRELGNAPLILDSATVVGVMLQLLNYLGFSPIILVGQNLAFRDQKAYADGAVGEAREKELIKEGKMTTLSVDGHHIETNEGFLYMKENIEILINRFQSMQVINTTRQGAHIEGAAFIQLRDLMEKELSAPITKRSLLPNQSSSYDHDRFEEQLIKIQKERKRLITLLDEMTHMLETMSVLAEETESDDSRKAIFNRIDRWLVSVDKNPYATYCLLPIIRTHHEEFARQLKRISREEELIVKVKTTHDVFGHYITALRKAESSLGSHLEIAQEDLKQETLQVLSFSVSFN
ncbi:motility associated factor glycosyltransferase family protein [Anoxynatronum buryatiense]|uniref:Uncharacterized conserved protein n=1 Tax=Anoxynatronum buryatiense TaxID=489973 RepID=A0AA46AIQ7_9CLOT|nr:6-hydroxymethylpterin diphosphokinase MptE-like protein [Anoxynatronum buryatiense]SMP52517.1 Uncharacterized conserved protein [Anoxynatronum buryatiense]